MSPKQTISRTPRLLLPAVLAAAMVPAGAFAADASGKHVSVVGGYSMVETTRNPEIAGARTDFAGEGTPTLGVTWHVTDNIGVEAWGADG
jgi:outer membrane protein